MTTVQSRVLSRWTRSQCLTLGGCALAQFAGSTVITTMTFGIFLLPVSSEFGWTRDVMSSAYGVLTISCALATPVVGRLIDRYEPRLVLGFASLLFAAATASVALLSASRALLFVLFAVWGVAAAPQTGVGYAKIVSAWFSRDRGLAMGLMMLGSAIGATIIPGLAQIMIQTFGWRAAYAGLGGLVLLVLVPAIFGLIRRHPVLDQPAQMERRDEKSGDERAAGGVSAVEAVRSYKFWFIAIAMFLMANVIVGLSLHLFPIFRDNGLSISAATTAITVSGIFMMAGRVLGGLAMDRFAKEKVGALFFAGPVAAIAVLCTSHGIVGAIVTAMIMGLCAGAEVAIASVLVAELFGLRAYGQIFSWVFVGFICGSGSGPWLLAKCFVIFGSYRSGLFLMAAFAITACILTYSLGRGRAVAEAELRPITP
jgi:MFS family permease